MMERKEQESEERAYSSKKTFKKKLRVLVEITTL